MVPTAFRLLLALGLIVPALSAQAAEDEPSYPKSLDVPYVPTNMPTVEAMLRVANIRPGDYLVDLGSGDGRIVVTAAKRFGIRGMGVDLNPVRVEESLDNARAAGVTGLVEFHHRNVFDTKFADASVVTMYLLPAVNLKLRPRLLSELKPGTRVVSHDFTMAEWKPDLTVQVRGVSSMVYLWVVPAKVEGRWNLTAGSQRWELELKQTFQEVEGVYQFGGNRHHISDFRLEGDRFSMLLMSPSDPFHRLRFEGRVSGNSMEGTLRGEGTAPKDVLPWQGVRLGSN